MKRVASAALLEPTRVTSALTIPTPLGPATVNLTNTRTHSSTVTTYSLYAHDQLPQTLKPMVQQHAELPRQLWKEFAKVVQALLDVHRSAANGAMGTSSGPAKRLLAPMSKAQVPRMAKGSHSVQVKSPTPLQTKQPSAAGMGTDSSGAAYAPPAASMSDGVEPFETDMTPAIPIEDWATGLWKEVAPQIRQRGLKMTISTSTDAVSGASSTPSPQPPSGKPLARMKQILKKQEVEERRKNTEGKAKAKAEKEKQRSGSSSTDLETPSEEEEPSPKR